MQRRCKWTNPVQGRLGFEPAGLLAEGVFGESAEAREAEVNEHVEDAKGVPHHDFPSRSQGMKTSDVRGNLSLRWQMKRKKRMK